MKILDIGANDGWWYRNTQPNYPDAEFTLIEANPYLEDKIKANGQPYYMVCLSDSVKEVDFYLTKTDITTTGASYYRENTDHFSDDNLHVVKLTTTTLDILFPTETFDFIKMDVQGAEVDIIRGGTALLSRSSKVLLEVPHNDVEYNLGAPDRAEYFDVMAELGFTNHEVLEDIRGLQQDILFTR
jgi:FkbM family methyltransferase